MQLHFQEKPWDLYTVVGYTVVMATVILALNVGDLFAILLVVFAPGYVLVAALFPGSPGPGKPGIDWIERVVLSFGLSISVVPLLGLLLNFTPWGVRFAPTVAMITSFTACVGLAAYWRRMRMPVERRLSLTIALEAPSWRTYGPLDKVITAALAASILVAIGTVTYFVVTPRPAESFTEFYLLGPGGAASGYPTALNTSQPGTVFLGIANHEAESIGYTIHVDLVGIQLVYNATANANETVDLNRTTWSWFNVTLADGQNWTRSYGFSIPNAGLWKVEFLLFKDGDFSTAYRELHLFVTVT
jgi:uncharacterized membrane protein